jgi:hypothetical protein
MNEPSWRYIAGFFDGEGCICLSKGKKTALGISMINADIDILMDILAKTGGSIYARAVKKPSKHRVSYSLQINERIKKIQFLQNIFPYLRIKRIQAELALEFLKSRNERGVIRGSHIPYNKREMEIIAIFRTLNRRGPR